MGKAVRFLTGFVLGVCAGAAAGLILVPESGAEVRHALNERVRAILAEAERAASQRRAELQQEFVAAKRLRPLPREQE
jgi:gas vesicle protein